jgi:hypothetical protein
MLFDMKSLKLKQRDRSPGLAASQHAHPAALSLLLGYGGREAVGWRVGRPGYLRPVKMRRDELMRCKPVLRGTFVRPESDCGRLSSRAHLGLTSARRAAFTIEISPAREGLRRAVAGSHRMVPKSFHREKLIEMRVETGANTKGSAWANGFASGGAHTRDYFRRAITGAFEAPRRSLCLRIKRTSRMLRGILKLT